MEAYKIHLSSLINLSGDPLINEENIQDTESKEELKQQRELPNMLLQNTVHEDEYDSNLEEVPIFIFTSLKYEPKWLFHSGCEGLHNWPFCIQYIF